MNPDFLVYKSSAGSGKTTILVKEYLKICLQNPGDFRHTLAITFTNKAANEMKSKVLAGLRDFSKGRLSHPMSMEISRETGLSPDQMALRAKQTLNLILHYYDEFSISTIDSFVHQIVRTFAVDLRLPQGFDVIIDQDDLIPFILEDLYDKLGKDPALTKILLQFVLSKVEDEKSYNLDGTLYTFIVRQLSEEGFVSSDEFAEWQSADFLKFIGRLQKDTHSLKNKIRRLAEDSLQLIASKGLDINDFYQKKSGVFGYFERLKEWRNKLSDLFPNSYVSKAIEEDLWYGNATPEAVKTSIDEIAYALKENLLNIKNLLQQYAADVLVYQNIYQVALIQEIRALLGAFTEKTGAVHISEFNKRIHKEIAGQPVPFIYERIGRRYKYFLIDEFQDTSVLQWNNLLPLIEESLANGNFNMLVGDAKQAIYRFRNGEVELFTHLPKLYNQPDTPENRLREQMLSRYYHKKKLTVNYRSREEIIAFNNAFFGEASKTLADNFKTVYEGHAQQLPKNKKEGGYVSICLLENEKAAGYNEDRLNKIVEWVDELAGRNYPLRDICVLTLSNASGGEIAAHLLSHGYPVVSADSMKLTISVEVNLVVAFLKCLHEPGNVLFMIELITHYHALYGDDSELHTLFTDVMEADNPLNWFFTTFGLPLPSIEVMRTRTVFEIAVEAVRLLIHSKQPNIFLQYFLDFVFEKQAVANGSLSEFLKLWDDNKDKLNIKMPDELDAIRVMTAHKAKGLKFGVVITDLVKRNNKLTRKYFWSEVTSEATETLPKALYSLGKDLEYIGKKQEYDYEQAKTNLDFLNLVYVAFTRAVDGLYVLGSLLKGKPDYFSKYLITFLEFKALWADEKRQFSFGNFPDEFEPSQSGDAKTVNLKPINVAPWYEHLLIAPVDEVYWEAMDSKAERTYGKLIHAILAQIRWPGEMERKVEAFYYAGIIDKSEMKKLKTLLQNVLIHPEVAPYFTKGLFIKSETDLFDKKQGKYLRADRVVLLGNQLTIIDYKTGQRKPAHIKQITAYADVYSRLGYKNIEKKLIYLLPDVEVISV